MPACHLIPTILISVTNIFNAITGHILDLTLYDMMCTSLDFVDVKEAFNDRMDKSIELFRSCFAIHLTNGSYFFMLTTLCFLVMAESIHLSYGRLSPAELKQCAERIGRVALSLLLAVPDVGFVIVRIAGLVILSRHPAAATSLVLVSLSPLAILPLPAYFASLLRRRKRQQSGEADAELGEVEVETLP